MLYSYFRKSGSNLVSDKNVRLADVFDRYNYSFHLELAKVDVSFALFNP